MFGYSNLSPIPAVWNAGLIERIRQDAETALKISKLIQRISGANHTILRDGEKKQGEDYPDVDELINKHIIEPQNGGHIHVGARILHYQKGPFLSPFFHLFGKNSQEKDSNGKPPTLYEKESGGLIYRELIIPSSESQESELPGYYLSLDTYRTSCLSSRMNPEKIGEEERLIILEDQERNTSCYLYNPDSSRIAGTNFGPRRLS